MKIIRIPIATLVQHEEYREGHVLKLMSQIKEEGCLLRPIAVSRIKKGHRNAYLIHDGHHRTEACRRLGFSHIVVNVIDFHSEQFIVRSWIDGSLYDKREIMDYAMKNKKFPTKTTKHIVIEKGEEKPFFNNDKIEPILKVRIEMLKVI